MSRLKLIIGAWQLPTEQRSLKQKAMLAGVWSTLAFFVVALMRLVSTIVLTRLLTPDVFGIFSVLLTVTFLMTMFSDLGVRSLILTREEEKLGNAFLWNCWTIQLLRGLVVGGLIVLIGVLFRVLQNYEVFPGYSSYSAPVLSSAISVSALAFIILSVESPNKFVYERDMKFGMVTVAEVAAATLSLFFVVGLALLLMNIWALVIASVLTAIARVVLSWALFKGPRMRLAWEKEHISPIIARGKWIVTHSGLTAITNVADRLLLGMFIPASSFGFYHIARQLIDMPIMLLNKIDGQIGLQVFSELHKHKTAEAFRRSYYKYRRFFDSMSMIGCGLLVTLAAPIVGIVYDDRYASVATILQILAMGLPLTGFFALRAAFNAQRRFRRMTLLSIIQAVSIWGGLIVALGVFNSVMGAFWVVALHRVPEALVLMGMGYREHWVVLWREFSHIPLIGVGALMGWGIDKGLLAYF